MPRLCGISFVPWSGTRPYLQFGFKTIKTRFVDMSYFIYGDSLKLRREKMRKFIYERHFLTHYTHNTRKLTSAVADNRRNGHFGSSREVR